MKITYVTNTVSQQILVDGRYWGLRLRIAATDRQWYICWSSATTGHRHSFYLDDDEEYDMYFENFVLVTQALDRPVNAS